MVRTWRTRRRVGAFFGSRWVSAAVAAVLTPVLLGACAAPGVATGTLEVTISAPTGVTPSVTVSGPGGFSGAFTSSQTLSGLVAGDYSVDAPAARRAGTLVDEAFDAAVGGGGVVTVAAGGTASVDVTYTRRPGTGALWISVWGGSKITAFDATQLGSAGGDAVTPALGLGLGSGLRPYSIAFDAEGDAWVGTQYGQVLEFAVADLGQSGTPAPVVVLTTGTVNDINGLAFAQDGTLWVTLASGLRAYPPAQLAASGSPPGSVTIEGTAAHPFSYPNALAFDGSGGLWVAANTFVARYSPAQLATGGALVPDVVLESNGTSLKTARGLAFDAAGALWVAAWSSGAVEKYRPEDLAAGGTPDPYLTLTGVGVYPLRLAFDNAGNLWVSSTLGPGFTGSGHVGMVAASNLVSSGSPALEASFTNVGSFDSGGTLAFAPAPAALPIVAP